MPADRTDATKPNGGARSHFHSLLVGNELERTRLALEASRADSGLSAAGSNVSRLLRPCLIAADRYAEVQRCAIATSQALESLHRAARQDAGLRQALRLPSWHEKTLDLEPPETPPVAARLDGLVGTDGQIRFIEYNTMPGGMYEMSALGHIFSETSIVRRFAQRYPVTQPDPLKEVFQALVENHRAAGKSGLPSMVVIDWPPPGMAPDLDGLAADLRRRGIAIREAGPGSDWSVDAKSECLALEGTAIDLVFFLNPLGLASFVANCSLTDPLIEGLRRGWAQALGGLFRTLFLGSKRVFAALSDPQFRPLLPEDVCLVLDRCIPWTRTLGKRRTTYRDEEIDLARFAGEQREQLVIKPPLGQGGAGVSLGWRTSPDDWNRALEQGIAEAWVVQERVQSTTDTYPLWRDGQLVFEELWWDLNPFVWRGERAEGCLVRVGSDPLLNVSAGLGSIASLFVLD